MNEQAQAYLPGHSHSLFSTLQHRWLSSTRPLRRRWLGFWLLPMMYDVCCQGGSIQSQLSQGTSKFNWGKSLKDFFFFKIFFITKKEHQKTQEQAASMRKPFQEKSLRWTAFQTVFSISKHKNHVMGNYSAERGPGFCFRKITPCNLLWAVSAAIPNAATGLDSGLRCNFSRLKIVFG